jgi:hypothetical protein
MPVEEENTFRIKSPDRGMVQELLVDFMDGTC